MTSPPHGARGFRGGIDGVLLVAVLLVAMNLRAPLTSVPPVVSQISEDLHLTAAAAGLLTGIPVLCFALTTPAVAGILARTTLRRAVAVALLLVLAGTVLRSVGPVACTFAGTVLIGLGITTGNLAVPMLARRDFPGHASTVTGLYTAAINVGTVATTALTAPLAGGIGWRWALGLWAVLAVGALVVWLRVPARGSDAPAIRSRRARRRDARGTPADDSRDPDAGDAQDPGADGPAGAPARERHVLASAYTWGLCAMFALQSSSFYALTAWLPEILEAQAGVARAVAGGAASLFQGFAIVGGLAVPLATRRWSLRTTFVGIAVLWLALPLGLLVAPAAWAVWASMAGVAQAANFVVIFTLVAQRFGTVQRARQASASVQTIGYSFAAVAPTAAGALHTATGTWTAPVAVVLGALVLMSVIGAVVTGRPAPPVTRPT